MDRHTRGANGLGAAGVLVKEDLATDVVDAVACAGQGAGSALTGSVQPTVVGLAGRSGCHRQCRLRDRAGVVVNVGDRVVGAHVSTPNVLDRHARGANGLAAAGVFVQEDLATNVVHAVA